MSEQNKALIRRFMDEVFTRRNLQAIDEFLGRDYVWHGPGGEEARGPRAPAR